MEESEIVSRFSKFTETRPSWTPTAAFCSCEGAGVQEMCVAVNPLLLCGPCLRPHPLESHSFLHRISSSAEPPIHSWQMTHFLCPFYFAWESAFPNSSAWLQGLKGLTSSTQFPTAPRYPGSTFPFPQQQAGAMQKGQSQLCQRGFMHPVVSCLAWRWVG